MTNSTRYNVGEEITNAVTHGIGTLSSTAGLMVLISLAALYGADDKKPFLSNVEKPGGWFYYLLAGSAVRWA